MTHNTEQEMGSDDRDRVANAQLSAIHASGQASDAAMAAANLTNNDWPATALQSTQSELAKSYRKTMRAIEQIEGAIEYVDHQPRDETTGEIMDEHADRYKERYSDPVWYVATQLLAYNRWNWLIRKPETQGALSVERHGLTENQRMWLDKLQDAWEEYDGE